MPLGFTGQKPVYIQQLTEGLFTFADLWSYPDFWAEFRMDRKMLRDDQWARIEQLLPGKATDRGVTAKDNRRFVEAVLWIMRTGSPWRDLPAELGHWHRTFVRFSRWREKGVWERVATALRSEADMEHLFLDSTIVRAHQHSAGAKKKRAISTSAARGVD